MTAQKKIVVFLSGRGSNFNALLSLTKDPAIAPTFHVIGVVSDNPGAAGLYYAREAGIPVKALFRRDFPNKDAFKAALLESALSFSPDLYVLAGFLQILPDSFVLERYGKILNIHPSLLPAFPGLDTHRRAVEERVPIHGCTTHYIDAGLDTGPIIAQAPVDVAKDDSADTLAARVLIREHELYPWTVSRVASGDISLEGRTVKFSPLALEEAKNRGFRVAPLP